MLFKILVSCFSLVLLAGAQFNTPASPCPVIFSYESDGNELYGLIRTQPGFVTSVTIQVNFTLRANYNSNYLGQVRPIGEDRVLRQQLQNGEDMMYRLWFPVSRPVPRITGITVNGNIICTGDGDVAGPGQYVSTISVEHMYYSGLRPNSFNSQRPTNRPTYTVPNSVPATYNGGGETFTINSDKNIPNIIFNTVNQDQNNYDFVVQQRPQNRPQNPEVNRPIRPVNSRWPATTPPAVMPRPQVIPPASDSSPESDQCGVKSNIVPLVFHGDSVQRGEWPWMVAIYVRKNTNLSFLCSGTLVSQTHVITAAHCMQTKTSLISQSNVVVQVGVFNLEQAFEDEHTVTRGISSADIHHSYNSSTLANDILVLTMNRPVKFNDYIRPACLWTGDTNLERVVGHYGYVIGWGTSERGIGGHGEPTKVQLPIVSTSACRASRPDFHKLTSEFTLCAGDRNGAGPCKGDSGGGLYVERGGQYLLRGIVSLSLKPDSGDTTCNLEQYIVFTDTAQYLPWIKRFIRI